jgi:hypothetical protein
VKHSHCTLSNTRFIYMDLNIPSHYHYVSQTLPSQQCCLAVWGICRTIPHTYQLSVLLMSFLLPCWYVRSLFKLSLAAFHLLFPFVLNHLFSCLSNSPLNIAPNSSLLQNHGLSAECAKSPGTTHVRNEVRS